MTAETKRFPVMAGIMLAILLAAMDQTIVSTAMPEIVRELHGLEHISWVFTAYMLASTITTPIFGKLSDIFGRRGLYLLAIVVFLAGSILSGAAHSMLALILFRGLQGIGGGAIMVTSMALIADIFPPAERGKWQGVIGGAFGVASVAGPLLGGWITDDFSWRWVFYVNIPLGILAMIVLWWALPKIPAHKGVKIDWLGAGLLATTLMPLLLGVVWGGSTYAWTSATEVVLFAVAALSLFFFLWREGSTPNPILSLGLFKNRVFAASVATVFLTAMGMFGAIVYIPLFAQTVLHSSATRSGLVLTPMMLALVFGSAVSGQVVSRTGKYRWVAIAGVALIVVGVFLFTTIGPNTTNLSLSLRMIVLGLGLGPTMPIFTLAVQSAFEQRQTGEVTAAVQMFRSIGGTVGTALLGGVMNSRLAAALAAGSSQTDAFIKAVDHVFLVGTGFMAAAFVAVWFLPQIALRRSHAPVGVVEEAGRELEDVWGQDDPSPAYH